MAALPPPAYGNHGQRKMNGPRNIYVARHGHREDFLGDEWRRTARRPHDPPLSRFGVTQARELALRVARDCPIDHLFASPFLRTIETAHYIAAATGQTVKIEEGICEWLNPDWFDRAPDYLPISDLLPRFPRIDPAYRSRVRRTYPEVDEATQAFPKVSTCVQMLLEEFAGDLLFIGHGSSTVGIARALGGLDALVMPRMCALMHFRQAEHGGPWTMLLGGCTRHLSITEEMIRVH